MPRRTRARLRQLREHLTRTRWRDDQAIKAYYTLLDAQKSGVSSVNLQAFDAVLKEYYKPDDIALMAMSENLMLSFFRGHRGETPVYGVRYVAGDRLYGRATGLDGFIPMVDDRPAQETQRTEALPGQREESLNMPTIVDEDIIRQKAVSDAYRDGWERCFGDADRAEEPAPLSEAKPGDTIECTIKSWANVQSPPLEVQIEMMEAEAASYNVCPLCGRKLDEHGLCPDL